MLKKLCNNYGYMLQVTTKGEYILKNMANANMLTYYTKKDVIIYLKRQRESYK